MVLRNQPTVGGLQKEGGRDKSCPAVGELYYELGIRISIGTAIQEAGITGRARHKTDLAGNVLTCNKVKGKEIVTNVGKVLVPPCVLTASMPWQIDMIKAMSKISDQVPTPNAWAVTNGVLHKDVLAR